VVLPHLELVTTSSGADRDPRGWSVSVLYYALLPSDQVPAVAGDKTEAIEIVHSVRSMFHSCSSASIVVPNRTTRTPRRRRSPAVRLAFGELRSLNIACGRGE
jgi:ADP-ribose pyrophosphatase YjhB (NUDIX family)